ncbi:MAG: WYL domain-containing protein [Oscillospiraceae bacterium]|nr:WYL domain-containing protein [Oscillospiraceae bacterium]
MTRSANQKLTLLILRDFLLRRSDEGHPVTLRDMIDELARHDIKAERKSLYDDIEALRQYGLDVEQNRGSYFVGERSFELPELKLLVDSIQSSKFVTQKKTLALIKKLEALASVYDAQLLERQVYVRNRVKSMNESVYYNVDSISDAINQDRAISFKYFEFGVDKQRRMRRDGAAYEVSPFALMWDDENYYMLAWDAAAGVLKHYRVDKMLSITALDRRRDGREAFAKVDMSAYSKKVFGMFTGEERPVRMRFAAHLAGAVIDRFGSDVMLIPDGGEAFTVTIDLAVSPRFFAWLFGFGTEAEILGPDDVRAAAADMARGILEKYEK